MQVAVPEAASVDAVLQEAEAPRRAQCLSNPQLCWEDRSVRGGPTAPQEAPSMKCVTKSASQHSSDTRCVYTDTHVCRRARTQPELAQWSAHWSARALFLSLFPVPLYFPAQSSCSQMASWVLGSATRTLFVESGWFFSCCKSFTTVCCHASPRRFRNHKAQIWTKPAGRLYMLHVKR